VPALHSVRTIGLASANTAGLRCYIADCPVRPLVDTASWASSANDAASSDPGGAPFAPLVRSCTSQHVSLISAIGVANVPGLAAESGVSVCELDGLPDCSPVIGCHDVLIAESAGSQR